MLCITMKRGEYFTVGDAVIHLESGGEHVRLSIDAPREIPIVRGAVLERMKTTPQDETQVSDG